MSCPMKGSVGARGANKKADTLFVQMLINEWLGSTKRTLLKVDGIVGLKTTGAIQQFQSIFDLAVDGRVDVDGPTYRKVAQFHLASMQGGTVNTSFSQYAPAVSPLDEDTYLADVYRALS